MDKPVVRVPAGSSRRAPQAGSLMLPRAPRSAVQAGDPTEKAFAGNYASSGSADRDWLSQRDLAVARTRDLVSNEPLAASAVSQKLSLLIGEGWHFEAAPDAATFGLDPASEDYRRLANSVEAAWRWFSNHPLHWNDYEESLPLSMQMDLLAAHYVVDGEGTAMLPFVAREGWYGTSLQVFDPDRLCQPAGVPDGSRGWIEATNASGEITARFFAEDMRGGVAKDARGRAVAYHVLDGHPHDMGLSALNRFTGRWIPALVPGLPTDTRPAFLHVFRPQRAGQTRGRSEFVPALSRYQYFRDVNEAELRTRLINALVVAQYTSQTNDPHALAELIGAKNAEQALEMRGQFYDEYGVSRIGGSRVIQTFFGDELKWNSEVRNAAGFVDTATFLAIQCGAPLGLSYALITRDFSKETFSSARTAINDAFRMVQRERVVIREKAYRKLLLCVLQEAYEAGELAVPEAAPSIWSDPGAYTMGKWIGPGREYVDPVKEAVGDRIEMENFTASPSEIAARRGKSFDDILAQWGRDRAKMEEAGMTMGDLAAITGGGAAHGSDDSARVPDPVPPAQD